MSESSSDSSVISEIPKMTKMKFWFGSRNLTVEFGLKYGNSVHYSLRSGLKWVRVERSAGAKFWRFQQLRNVEISLDEPSFGDEECYWWEWTLSWKIWKLKFIRLKEFGQKGDLLIGVSESASDDSISSVTSNIVKMDYWVASGWVRWEFVLGFLSFGVFR